MRTELPVVITRFRVRRADDPTTFRGGRTPEMHPGETTVTCSFCGYWGIAQTSDVQRTQDPDGPSLACQECGDDLGWST